MTTEQTQRTYLSDIATGDSAVITRVAGHGAFRKRITEMGFVRGKSVTVVKNAPLQDPIEYEIMGYHVSLRRSEARRIEVLTDGSGDSVAARPFKGTMAGDLRTNDSNGKGRTINVALVGNPNSGKTTLFNLASGSHERVGNYGGVTVDAKEATLYHNGYVLNVVDLPGTYSITEFTPEELFVRTHILESMPDVVINVIDGSNLERNLFLTTQLIDMNIKVVIALNMYDELEKKSASFDYHSLGAMIGIPIVPTIAVRNFGISALIQKVIDVFEEHDPLVRHIHINYGSSIEAAIAEIQAVLKANTDIAIAFSTRYLAIKLLENDKTTRAQLSGYSNYTQVCTVSEKTVASLEKEFGEKSETVIADAKYGFIAGALSETYVEKKEDRRNLSVAIDKVLTDKLFGFPVFLLFLWVMFQATFSLGEYPMEWIDAGVGLIGDFLRHSMPDGALRDLLADGIIGGVGGVIVFLPNILILFFFISLMEDTGYMARVSFIMDKLMHKIGLHGKSFIPLLMGFGCNVPAVMATRTIESRKDRVLTMLITPFMSCSARLPVYVLLISAFFPHHRGLVLFSIYMLGILLAIISALLLKKLFFAKQEMPFVMELPPYRVPTLRNAVLHMWHKAVQYLQKMGGVILLASILIWALSYYPHTAPGASPYPMMIERVHANNSLTTETRQKQVDSLERLRLSEHSEKSFMGQLGHIIEPVIRPLGFDWKIGVSIIAGLAAKEVVVSSMGILYQANVDADGSTGDLSVRLRSQEYASGPHRGEKVYTPLTAYCLMVFILIYFPCVAVITAIKKESHAKWAIFTVVYTTSIAWLVTFLVHQFGSLLL
jgi:ferrous iron transport protein B